MSGNEPVRTRRILINRAPRGVQKPTKQYGLPVRSFLGLVYRATLSETCQCNETSLCHRRPCPGKRNSTCTGCRLKTSSHHNRTFSHRNTSHNAHTTIRNNTSNNAWNSLGHWLLPRSTHGPRWAIFALALHTIDRSSSTRATTPRASTAPTKASTTPKISTVPRIFTAPRTWDRNDLGSRSSALVGWKIQSSGLGEECSRSNHTSSHPSHYRAPSSPQQQPSPRNAPIDDTPSRTFGISPTIDFWAISPLCSLECSVVVI